MEDYLGHIDLYEVEKNDYRSYEYRCKDRQIMKITPREGMVVYRDVKTGEWLYGDLEYNRKKDIINRNKALRGMAYVLA